MTNKAKIRILSSGPDFKVLEVIGDSGDCLKKHKVDQNALLLMREGSILYQEPHKEQLLLAGSCWNIPAGVLHEVSCLEKAKFFLVLPEQTKMKFNK